MTTSPGVAISGLESSYGTTRVLRGLDLVVTRGDIACVLGPSGCGKTTLLRVLAGFLPAEAGTVSIGGRVVDDGRHCVAPEDRRVGYVPQEGALFPHLTVAGNVGFALARRSRRQRALRRGRVEELLELVGLAGFGHRRPDELSGGQQQRVALARALICEPDLVLLDEPFAALDASLRHRLRLDVRAALAAAGVTAILVTHDQTEALSLGDQVVTARPCSRDRPSTSTPTRPTPGPPGSSATPPCSPPTSTTALPTRRSGPWPWPVSRARRSVRPGWSSGRSRSCWPAALIPLPST